MWTRPISFQMRGSTLVRLIRASAACGRWTRTGRAPQSSPARPTPRTPRNPRGGAADRCVGRGSDGTPSTRPRVHPPPIDMLSFRAPDPDRAIPFRAPTIGERPTLSSTGPCALSRQPRNGGDEYFQIQTQRHKHSHGHSHSRSTWPSSCCSNSFAACS